MEGGFLISADHDLDRFKSHRAQFAHSTSKQKTLNCGLLANYVAKLVVRMMVSTA